MCLNWLDRRACGDLDLAHAGVVVDELGLALRVARWARRLRSLVGAGKPVLLVVEVLALVAGAGAERPGLVAVGVVADGEGADGRRRMRTRRSWRRIAVGKVIVGIGLGPRSADGVAKVAAGEAAGELRIGSAAG